MILFNNEPIIIKHFPNGESLLDKPFFEKYRYVEKEVNNIITLKYESDVDLFQLLLVRKSFWFPCDLHITYFPYSRMDRQSESYVFTLKTVAKFINWLDWNSVKIYEPHSDVTPALLNKCRIIPIMTSLLSKTDFNNEIDYVFYPDAGAHKKYSDVIKAKNELIGFKKRDFTTGKIKELQILGSLRKDARVFIIDDLCSKGGTFKLAGQQLKAMGAREVNLVVAHCEQTIFEGTLLTEPIITKIYTTNSIIRQEHKKIISFDLNTL